MKPKSARYRPWIVYAALSLMSLSLMTSNLQGGIVANHIESAALRTLAPLFTSVDRLVSFTRDTWTGYIYLVNLQEENKNLRQIISTIQEKHLLLTDKAGSVERLEHLINASHRVPQASIRANVIRRGNTLLNPTILVDRGSKDGLREGLGVATAHGALGMVVHVTHNISKVLTLHHSDAGIGAILQQSRVQGVVSGTGKGVPVMRFISRFDRVTLGEEVVTSGLDGAFPKGIPVGRIASVRRDAAEIFQTLEIVPYSNINAAEEVIIFIISRLPDPDSAVFSGSASDLSEKSSIESVNVEVLN